MKKTALYYALAAASALLVNLGIAHAEPPVEVAQMQTEMLAPTVQLDGNCSGQIIDSKRDEKGDVHTYVLTAAHCTEDYANKKEVKVQVPVMDKDLHVISEQVFFGEVKVSSYSHDLTLVQLRDHQTQFTKLAKLAPLDVQLYESEPTWAVGYSLGENRVITDGKLNVGLHISVGDEPMKDWVRATPAIAPGNSGGGLYHKNAEGRYELIGTATRGVFPFTFIGLYEGISDIQNFLKTQAFDVYTDLYPPKLVGR